MGDYVVLYTVLIDGHIKVNNFVDAIRLFNEFIKRGLEPDNVTYTALFSGLLNSGHSETAVTLYNEMSSKGMTPPLHINQRILKVRKLQFSSGEL
jgi:pentatricopeptide repeat protein